MVPYSRSRFRKASEEVKERRSGAKSFSIRAGRVLLAIHVLASLAQGQSLGLLSSEGSDLPISIDAETMEYLQHDSVIGARGKVVVSHGDATLRADELRFSRATKQARASGNVAFEGSEGRLTADSVDLDLSDETGTLTGMELHAKDNRYSLWGGQVEKGLGQQYHIENGRFTTCRCSDGPPSWSFSGEKFDVALGGYADLHGGRFNILDVPVLYLPRAFFPIEVDRQSGFLMPRFGASSRRGFQTLLPFYLVLDKSHDATIALDLETSARIGMLGEYRYARSRTSSGILGSSYFNESIRGRTQANATGEIIPQNRWNVLAQQREELPGEVQAYSDVFLVSDDLFLREIHTYSLDHQKSVATRTLPYTESHLGLYRPWPRVAAQLDATYYQNLAQTAGQTESSTLQRLPEFRLWGQQKLDDIALLGVEGSAVSFQRARGTDGFRADLLPTIQVPLPIGPYAFGSIHASGRETAYRLLSNELEDGRSLPSSRSREIFHVGATVETSISRVMPAPWDSTVKLKHIVEPLIDYRFVPTVGQEDLAFFDGVDRVNARNQFTYGFASRVLEKSGEAARGDVSHSIRELGRVSITQSVDLSRKIDPISCEVGEGQPCGSDHFSDVDISGRLNPSRFLSVRFRNTYDTNNSNLTATQVGFLIEDPRKRATSTEDERRISTTTSAGVSYRFLAPNRLQQLDSNLILELTDWAGFLYASRYDVVQNRFLDNFYGLRFLSQCDCWSLDLTVTDRTNPRELEVRAQISLAGLGGSKSQRRSAFLP